MRGGLAETVGSDAAAAVVSPKGGLKPASPEASGMSTHYFFAGVYQMGEV